MSGYSSLAEALKSMISDVADQPFRPVGANVFLSSLTMDGTSYLLGLRVQFVLFEVERQEEKEPVEFSVKGREPGEAIYRFQAEYLPWEDAIDCLMGLVEPVWRGLTNCINQNPNHYVRAIAEQYDDHMQWPGSRLDFRLDLTGDLNGWDHWGPVVNVDVGTFQNLRAALLHHMWPGPVASWAAVLMPFGEARLLNAEWQDDRILVEVESAATSDPPTIHVTTYGLRDRPVHVASVKITERVTELPIPSTTSRADVYLWGQGARLLGRLQLMSRGMSESSIRRSVTEQALEDFRTGENERIEFKPFVGKGDTKEPELIRTVVAFANGSGGRLYLGVDDDGNPLGEQSLDRVDKNRGKDRLKMVEQRMQALIREHMSPVPSCALTWIEVYGNQVLVVEVDEGPHKPYSSQPGNEIVIRAAATNRRPDPHSELKALFDAQSRDYIAGSLFE